jgi:hypothetical protein
MRVEETGRISASGGDEAIRGKIIQVLFTAPGERVNLPEFGCGLFNLVFEPNDAVLAAAMEFTIGQALTRWLRDDIMVEAVNVTAEEEKALVEIVYTKREDLSHQMVRIQFR